MKIILRQNLCFGCLGRGHRVESCPALPDYCPSCARRHSPLMRPCPMPEGECNEEAVKKCCWCEVAGTIFPSPMSHSTEACIHFRRQRPSERREFAQLTQMCIGCLKRGHKVESCPTLPAGSSSCDALHSPLLSCSSPLRKYDRRRQTWLADPVQEYRSVNM